MARSSTKPRRVASTRLSPPRRLSLPSEGDIAREMARNVDPDAIFVARESLRGALGRAHAPGWRSFTTVSASGAHFSPDAASAGRRALRNVALSMLAAGKAEEGAQRAQRQLAGANNMTERFAALAVLSLDARTARANMRSKPSRAPTPPIR